MEAKLLDCGEKKKDLAEQAKGQESSSNSVGNGEAMKMDKAIHRDRLRKMDNSTH